MLLKRLGVNGWVNLLIVVTCGVMLTVTMQRSGLGDPQGSRSAAFHVGDRAEAIPAINYETAPRTVVLYLKSTCQYCTDSMSFYDRLSESAAKSGTRIVAVSSETTDTLQRYLEEHHLRVDDVVGGFSGKAVRTPTLLVVDRLGTVRGAWVGQQPPDAEKGITSSLSSGTGS